MPYHTTFSFDCGALGSYSAEVEFNYIYALAGKFDGPPENCFPDEPEELDILSVKILFPFYSEPLDVRELVEDDESLREACRKAAMQDDFNELSEG